MTPPLHFQTVSSLSAMMRKGEISPVSLTEHFLSRIERLEETLGAFQLLVPERALAEARAAEITLKAGIDLGPLHGIPYAAKDLFDVRGLATTAGSRLLADNIAKQDSEAVRRLSRAGMVLLGKTRTVQFAYGGVGINHDCGTPRNPWKKSHYVPGGSSSGSAVAVASGLVPAALGTDTGGSVRIPASLCGIVGLKTTVGRISRAGVYPLSFTLDSVGTLSRSVEDAALLYHQLQGSDPQDDTTGTMPCDVLSNLKKGVAGMRLAFAEAVFWEDADPEVEKAVGDCGRVFRELGARVSSMAFPEADEARKLNPRGLVIASEGYSVNRKYLEESYDSMDPVVSSRMIRGREVSAPEYIKAIRAWKDLRKRAIAALQDVDGLLVPTTSRPALPVSHVDRDPDTYVAANFSYLRNTTVGNILNLCGLSLPCGFTRDGLPIGLMIYAKPFAEDVLLRIGYAFEQQTDWHRKNPQWLS